MHRITDKLFLVVAADGLAKPDVFSLPDPFVVIIVDSKQIHATSVITKTLNPYWNEHSMCPWFYFQIRPVLGSNFFMTNIQYGERLSRCQSSDIRPTQVPATRSRFLRFRRNTSS